MVKRGQITIFIIIAILIVGIITMLFITKNKFSIKEESNPEAEKIYSFVQTCIKETGNEAVTYAGWSGGYFENPNLSTENYVAYYFYEEKNYMPAKEEIENQLSNYMDEMLFFCTKNFIDFPDFEVKQGEIKTKSFIENDKVKFEIDYPIAISKENKTYVFEKFNSEINVRLGIIYEAIKKFMEEQIKTPKDICLTCIEEICHEYEIAFSLDDYDKKTIIFSVIDEKSKIKGENFAFYFANKY